MNRKFISNRLVIIPLILSVVLLFCVTGYGQQQMFLNASVSAASFASIDTKGEGSLKEKSLTPKVTKLEKSYFIDQHVDEPQTIVAQLSLSEDSGIYHLVSHGRPGELLINGKWLDEEEIVDWIKSKGLNKKELYIYGCEFAKGEEGRDAVAYLQNHLGVSVAASTNITGKDGDWLLEVGNKSLAIDDYAFNLQTLTTTSTKVTMLIEGSGNTNFGSNLEAGISSWTGGKTYPLM
jgi:hypothetical protein